MELIIYVTIETDAYTEIKMNVISVKCPNCGASLDIDLDNPAKYCNMCGSKIMLDVEAIQDLMIEKERTKQEEIKSNKEVQIAQIEEQHIHTKYITKLFEILFKGIIEIFEGIIVILISVIPDIFESIKDFFFFADLPVAVLAIVAVIILGSMIFRTCY